MLIEKGVEDEYISKNYKLYGQRKFVSTLSPGEMLYDNMKKWPHWTSKIN